VNVGPTCRAPAGGERQRSMWLKHHPAKWNDPWCLRSYRHATCAWNLSPCAISMMTTTVPNAWRYSQRHLLLAYEPLSSLLYQRRQTKKRLSRWRSVHPCWLVLCRLLCTPPMAVIPSMLRACPCRASCGAQRHDWLWQGNVRRVGLIRRLFSTPFGLGKGSERGIADYVGALATQWHAHGTAALSDLALCLVLRQKIKHRAYNYSNHYLQMGCTCDARRKRRE